MVFDPRTGSRGTPTRTIFVGSADPGPRHLFRSDDAGKTWIAVAGGPGREMLPAQAQIDDQSVLYITYGNGTGPNGVSDGAVMKFDTVRRWWTDITPDKRPDHPKGGYCGLSLDRERPGTLAVSTMNRWMPVDTVWRSTDAGRTWMDIADKSVRDVRATPFLLWGNDKAKLGWWMAALAIDPFDSRSCRVFNGCDHLRHQRFFQCQLRPRDALVSMGGGNRANGDPYAPEPLRGGAPAERFWRYRRICAR